MGELTVIQNPFNPSDGRLHKVLTQRVTIRNIIEEYQSEDFDIVCSVNGVPCVNLDYVVEDGDRVHVMARLRGGGGDDGGGSKNILRTIAMVVVAVVVTYVTAGGASSIAGGWLSSAGIGATAGSVAAFGAVAMTAGMMLVNAVLPPPTPSTKATSYEQLADSNTYGWNPARNQINEGLTAPVLYGKTRIAPQVISQRRSFEQNKDKLNILFFISEGRCDAATPEVTINGRPTTDFTGASVSYARGTLDQAPLGNSYDDIVYQKAVNVVLDPDEANAGTLTVTTDGNAVERLAVGVTLVGGLYAYVEGGYHFLDTGFRAEYRLEGTSTWLPFGGMGTAANYSYVQRKRVRIGTEYIEASDADEPHGSEVGIYEWRDVTVVETKHFDEVGYWFVKNSPDTIRVRVENQGTLTPGRYEVRVTKLRHHKALSGNTSNLNQMRFDFVEELIPEDLTYPGRCVLGLNAVAQEEIYGQAPVINVVADRGELELYQGEWGNSAVRTGCQSSNPAWACYDLLTNPLYGAGIHPNAIVLQEFVDWATHCDSENLKVGIYLDNNMTMYDALNKISQLGRGTIVQRGTKYGAMYDAVSPMVYFFGMGQIIEGTLSMGYLERESRANVIEVTYYDEDYDYTRKVFELRSESSTPDKKASINLIGCTNRTQASRHAQLLLRGNQHLVRSVTFQADIESIHCQVGDVIGVSHDVPQYGWSGRVMSSTATTVTLDRTITLGAGSHNVIIRHADDTLETKAVTESDGDFSTLTLSSGSWSQNPAYMSAYTCGIVNSETKLFRVMAIRKSQEFQAEIHGMEYNPAIYNLDADVPDYEPTNGLPSVRDLQVSQSFARLSDGSYQGALEVTWEGYSTEWKVQIWNESRPNSHAQWSADTSERRFSTPALPVGDEEVYRVRVTGLDGEYEESSLAFAIDKPNPVVNLRYKVLDNFVFLNWEQPVSELPIDRYEIYEGFDLDTAELIGTVAAGNFNTYEGTGGDYVYHVMAVNVAGMKSDPRYVHVPVRDDTNYALIDSLKVDGTGPISDVYWDGAGLLGPFAGSTETWDSVWQSNYPSDYTTKTWDEWPADRGVTTLFSALGTSGATSGTYSQTWDLGSLYPGRVKVDVKLNKSTPIGNPLSANVKYTLEFSADGVTYYSRTDATTLQEVGFQFIRLTLNFTSDGEGAVLVSPELILSAKQITQSGREDIDDLETGTTIALTKDFHDVHSITVTAKGTSALTGVYDFDDVPNPTEFTAYLFDKDGNSVFGDFSYSVVGV